MATWRLIAHHYDPDAQIRAFSRLGCVAIGWSGAGNLAQIAPASAAEITPLVRAAYPQIDNAHLGGPSLWRFYDEMAIDDLVIIGDGSRRRGIMRVTGPYTYTTAAQARAVGDYRHRRSAVVESADPNQLWASSNYSIAPQENIRWTLVRCA
jgi:hypothetical protein